MLRAPVIALVASALLVGCSDDPPATPVADAASDIAAADVGVASDDVPPPDRPRPPDVARTDPDEARAAQRLACAYGPGAFAVETVGREVPIGEQMPIDHIIVVMQENRSFDHYFRQLPRAGQTDVDVAADDWSNPGADGAPVRFHHDTQRCVDDVQHGWNAVHAQYNTGRMDGFVTTNNPSGDRALTYFDETDIPFYYSLATTFAIGDRYFCSLLGPTGPNRMFLMAGTSFGLAHNTLVSQDTRANPASHLFSRLDDAGVSWKDYAGGPRMLGFFPYYGIVRGETRAHFGTIDDLHRDLAAGTLPAVTIVEPNYVGDGGDRVDEHPPGIPMQGERYVERIVRSLMASPLWPRSALFIVYDEHGGFADHVAPPPACEPDDLGPRINGQPAAGRFDRYGVRVPFMVVSPYARRHFVSHRTFDHGSILRFIEARFGLPALTRRDANANLPTDLFDFANPPFMTPPTLPSAGVVDPAVRERCAREFPSSGAF
jgi:phospholipase C